MKPYFSGTRGMSYASDSIQYEPARQPRPVAPSPYPAGGGDGPGPRRIDGHEKIMRRSKDIIERMQKIEPRRAENYRQRTGE